MEKIFLILSAIIFLLSCQSYTKEIGTEVKYPVLPVLTHKNTNPVIRVDLLRQASETYEVKEINLALAGQDIANTLESISIYHAKKNGMIDTSALLCKSVPAAEKVSFKDSFTVDTDSFSFWVSLKLKKAAPIQNQIQVQCSEIRTNKGRVFLQEKTPMKKLRIGVAVRQQGQDGVHTSRIPGLATSKKGTLLAIYDARWESERDLQGNIDIALNCSMDGGVTWQPMQIVLDQKEWGGLPQKYNGVSDACILVDDNTGDIYVAGLWMHGVLDRETGKWVEGLTEDSTRWIHQWRKGKGSQPGFGVKETTQFLLTKSKDDGLTWSDPMNLTSIKKRNWWLFAPAPGHGITLKDGTLIFPTEGRDDKGDFFSSITWSKDHGKTWVTSNPAHKNTTECMAAELSDGPIMLNMRDDRNRKSRQINGRTIATTNNLGKTWTEHPTSRKALIEPNCMASLHKHAYKENGIEKSLLLFVNPNSISKREHITLKVSFDDGQTWPEDHWILLDEYVGRGYSCITSVDEQTIGVLYESSQADLVFQQIPLFDLVNLKSKQ